MTDRRAVKRVKLALNATVTSPDHPVGIKCAIRDASAIGCMLISSHVHELPDLVDITIAGMDEPLAGRIVWRETKSAGVEFNWPEADQFTADDADWIDLDADTSMNV